MLLRFAAAAVTGRADQGEYGEIYILTCFCGLSAALTAPVYKHGTQNGL
jgi:hypothetical protein